MPPRNSLKAFALPKCDIFYLTKSLLKTFSNGDRVRFLSLACPIGNYSIAHDGDDEKYELGFPEDVFKSTIIRYVKNDGKHDQLIINGYSVSVDESPESMLEEEHFEEEQEHFKEEEQSEYEEQYGEEGTDYADVEEQPGSYTNSFRPASQSVDDDELASNQIKSN